MESTRCLREEHMVILKVLDCFELALSAAGRSGRVDVETFSPFVEFFQGFADRCHHCKEEDRLFPCLEQCGMPRDEGPIAVMLHEHQVGRARVRALAEALPAAAEGDTAAAARVLDEGRRFLELLRHHIMKEDHVLFEMADQVISRPRMAELSGSYAQAQSEAGYRSIFARCRALADELCARHGVEPPPPFVAT